MCWDLIPGTGEAEKVKAMVREKIKASFTHLFVRARGRARRVISRETVRHVRDARENGPNLVSKMMITKELRGAWDQPTKTIVLRRLEPSPVQAWALAYADRCAALVDANERLLDAAREARATRTIGGTGTTRTGNQEEPLGRPRGGRRRLRWGEGEAEAGAGGRGAAAAARTRTTSSASTATRSTATRTGARRRRAAGRRRRFPLVLLRVRRWFTIRAGKRRGDGETTVPTPEWFALQVLVPPNRGDGRRGGRASITSIAASAVPNTAKQKLPIDYGQPGPGRRR